MSEPKPIPACNLCGEPCSGCRESYGPFGLIDCRVSGGYDSTPGNGCGALDDMSAYTFSLCEFCLDWLFSQFKTPPAVVDYGNGKPLPPFRPAATRVREDEWRSRKAEFFEEFHRRHALRQLRSTTPPAGISRTAITLADLGSDRFELVAPIQIDLIRCTDYGPGFEWSAQWSKDSPLSEVRVHGATAEEAAAKLKARLVELIEDWLRPMADDEWSASVMETKRQIEAAVRRKT